jgi:hypothetical protein
LAHQLVQQVDALILSLSEPDSDRRWQIIDQIFDQLTWRQLDLHLQLRMQRREEAEERRDEEG